MAYYMYPQPTNGRASSNDFSVNTWLSKFYENGSSSIFIYSTGMSSWGETYFPSTISDNLNSCCVISISIRQASQVLSTTFESLARHQTTADMNVFCEKSDFIMADGFYLPNGIVLLAGLHAGRNSMLSVEPYLLLFSFFLCTSCK